MLGLLHELSKSYEIEMLVLTRQPLSEQQIAKLNELANIVLRIPLKDVTVKEKIRALILMVKNQMPYHSAVLISSLRDHPDIRQHVESYPGIVFTSNGHWGTLVQDRCASNWILNQCDADVDFWRVYASQARHLLVKVAALVNWWLSKPHFQKIYRNVGHIISVCEEDRELTQELAPSANIHVVENGIDCMYYKSDKKIDLERPPRLLFTGTSARRNVTALTWFAKKVLPLIRKEIPAVEFLVAGNFKQKAQKAFKKIKGMSFTGRINDIRTSFNQSDVYVAPFQDTHGTKLKIAEAMAMEMAIVSTTAGVRGFQSLNKDIVKIAETSEEFAKYCIDLLRSRSLRLILEENARQYAETTLDWKVLGGKLRRVIVENEKANSKI